MICTIIQTVQLLDKKGNLGAKTSRSNIYEAFKKTGVVDTAGSFYDKGNKNAKLLLYKFIWVSIL